ncbi:MAG: CHAT domain-containing protein [Pyrinomonadaceae bacterium]
MTASDNLQSVKASFRGVPSYPQDVALWISRDGSYFKMQIFYRDFRVQDGVTLTPDDLDFINKVLSRALKEVVNDQSSSTDSWRQLAEAGYYAFRSIFSTPRLKDAARRIFTPAGRKLNVQIASGDFSLPWELLYPVEVSEGRPEELFNHFWGMSHVISRSVAPSDQTLDSEIPFSSKPVLGLLADRDLEYVRDKEIRYFEGLAGDDKIALKVLADLDAEDENEGLRAFKGFWRDAYHLAHFACHAFYEVSAPPLSYVNLTKRFRVRLMNIINQDIEINGHPLVFFNACETGRPSPLYTSSFAGKFIELGARGVVVSEGEVPDDFAADFAEQLYNRLLDGAELGESLLAARRYFLETRNNPSGLLYAMYAPPSIRLSKI